MDTDNFIVYTKTDHIHKDIREDVGARCDTSNHELDRILSKQKNKNVIGLMKDEIYEKVVKEFVGLGAKTYIYLVDNGSENKKAKDTKKWVIKRILEFENYKNCLEKTRENKVNHLE